MRRVFVSYSRNNLAAVTQLIEDMRAVGIDIWYHQALTGGQRWWDGILAHMKTETQTLLLQIKKRGGWRDFVGMATSLNILFHQ